MRTLLCAGLLLAGFGCAHLSPTPGSDLDAQDHARLFFKTLRWEGPRASSELLAPELQPEYLDDIKARHLQDHLKITEFEVNDLAHIAKHTVTFTAKVGWYIDPGITVKRGDVTLHMQFRNGAWAVTGIDGGPIPIAPLPPERDGGR